MCQQLPPFPCLVVWKSDIALQASVVVEGKILSPEKTVKEEMLTLVAAYFGMNISFPKPLYPVLVFIQHQILKIKDEQHEPNITKIVLSTMHKQ